MYCELDSMMSELSGFVYIRSHVTLHVNSKAQKVNCSIQMRKDYVYIIIGLYLIVGFQGLPLKKVSINLERRRRLIPFSDGDTTEKR